MVLTNGKTMQSSPRKATFVDFDERTITIQSFMGL